MGGTLLGPIVYILVYDFVYIVVYIVVYMGRINIWIPEKDEKDIRDYCSKTGKHLGVFLENGEIDVVKNLCLLHVKAAQREGNAVKV